MHNYTEGMASRRLRQTRLPHRRPSNGEWPPDLGYWMGYRIAKSYYEQAADKRQAIVDILALTDFNAFLDASGYAKPMSP